MAGLLGLRVHTILDLVTTALAERNSSRMNDEEAAPWWLVLALALNAYATVRLNVDKETTRSRVS